VQFTTGTSIGSFVFIVACRHSSSDLSKYWTCL